MKSLRLGAGALVLLAASAPVPRGKPAELLILNASGETLECHALAGHWFGFDLGEIASGGKMTLGVFYDRASGMVAWQNTRGRLVPLQSVYCGRPGAAWQSRAVVPLREPLANATPVICSTAASGLRCAN